MSSEELRSRLALARPASAQPTIRRLARKYPPSFSLPRSRALPHGHAVLARP